VQEHLDGTIHMVYRDKKVTFMEIKELLRKVSEPYQKTKPHELRKSYVPAADHPWRSFTIKAKPLARALTV